MKKIHTIVLLALLLAFVSGCGCCLSVPFFHFDPYRWEYTRDFPDPDDFVGRWEGKVVYDPYNALGEDTEHFLELKEDGTFAAKNVLVGVDFFSAISPADLRSAGGTWSVGKAGNGVCTILLHFDGERGEKDEAEAALYIAGEWHPYLLLQRYGDPDYAKAVEFRRPAEKSLFWSFVIFAMRLVGWWIFSWIFLLIVLTIIIITLILRRKKLTKKRAIRGDASR